MSEVVLKIDNVSKQYRLGLVGTGTLSHDLNRRWHLIRGKDDPYLKVGTTNDRENAGGDYVWALKDIFLEVNKGDIIGIIGKNGAGKSTLLKLLSQVTGPTTGSINIKGRIAALLEVGTGFHPELTGRENIFLNGAILGMSKSEIRNKIDEIIDFSGVAKYIDTPVKRYSSGMMVRLGFAVAAHLEPEILVVDEVLAVGDAEFQKKCLGKMKDVAGQGRTVLFVSHNMGAVKNLCTRAIWLKKGQIAENGNVDTIIENYLNNTEPKAKTGEIHKSSFTINTGKAIFKNFFLKNSDGVIIKTAYLGQKMSLELELEVIEPLEKAIIDISIGCSDEKVLYSSTYDVTKEFIFLEAGQYMIKNCIEPDLLPGNYFISIGIHNMKSTTSTINYAEKVYLFNVLEISQDNTDRIPIIGNSLGKLRVIGDWNISKK